MSQELDNNDNEDLKPTDAPELDIAAIMARVEKLEGSNGRLLEESKAWKSKYQGLSHDVEAKQKADLEKTENWKDLLEIEKNKRSEFESQLRETKKSVLQKELGFKVASIAKDAHDVNDIISSLPKDMIAIDEESLTVSGISEAVNYVREAKPWLFNKENKSGMSSARPEGVAGKQTYDELSNDDKDAIFRKALEGMI
jgi:hypothetical protein